LLVGSFLKPGERAQAETIKKKHKNRNIILKIYTIFFCNKTPTLLTVFKIDIYPLFLTNILENYFDIILYIA